MLLGGTSAFGFGIGLGFGFGFDFGLGFGLLFGFLGEGGAAAATLEYDEKEGTKQLKEAGNQAMTE